MSTVIRSLMVKVGADLTDMQKGLKQAAKDLTKAGKEISSAGSSLTKGLTVPIIGAAAGLTTLAVKASETADDLKTMSAQTGISTETIQKLQYASKFVDVELETMQKGLAKVTKATGAAAEKGENYITVADGLTVSTVDANGKLKDSEQMFYDMIDALGGMTDETQREIAAQEIFGKSYQDLMPLITAGSGALKTYGEEAEKVGAVLSDKTVDSLANFNDTVEQMKSVLSTAGAKIGAAFVPILEKLQPIIQEKIVPAIEKFAGFISSLIEKFSELSPKTQNFIIFAIGLVAALGPMLSIVGKLTTGIGGVVKAISGVVGIISGGGGIMSAISVLMGPVGWVIAAIAAIAAAAYLIITNWDQIKEFFINLWETVTGAFKSAWDGIKTAFTSVWEWLKTFFAQWGPVILAVVAPFIGIPLLIIKNWDVIKEALANIWNAVKTTAVTVWTSIKESITGIFNGIWSAIKGVINSILGGVEGMANGVIKGINFVIKALNKLSFTVPEWVPELGGKSFGFDIKTLKTIEIPRLAKGAVIHPNDEFLAMLGDQKSGVNIETPLSTMIEAFEAAGANQGSNDGVISAIYSMASQIVKAVKENNADVYLDQAKLGRIMASEIARQNQRSGPSLVTVR